MSTRFLFLLKLDWQSILLGENKWQFLIETGIRSVIMFVVILLSLRLLGRRGIKQLSVFELGVIIGLGSAAGDPMFYKDVGLLPAMVVFVFVILLYKLVTLLVNKSEKFERFVEGRPVAVISSGRLIPKTVEQEPIAKDEIFMQLRLSSVWHLGQVERAILETNGEISVFCYDDENTKPGLPIIPELFDQKNIAITKASLYACVNCGATEELSPGALHVCKECDCKEWVEASYKKRIA